MILKKTSKKISKSAASTKIFGRNFAEKILKLPLKHKAVIIGLAGELGSGKTSFLQGFAAGLGIKEKILSPTFVIFKRFAIKKKWFKNFYHFDCYRMKNEKELSGLAFKQIIADPGNVVAIEWPEKIKKILPKDFFKIKFRFINKNTREIIIYDGKTFGDN
ncbi:MAG: tRNA (adenosine(37)-N6)-threonylcarbamoyltransferase complex ATPase subunit type 1 TsaE [Candidatus Nealsonbacteria bacterium]|nr:tRNA (adenosine(37)-N6)-threonylcarbamoyltransferase complex ATPase subunit type 1 TsaE [Candidatus Nealsonbacteria bacterium]